MHRWALACFTLCERKIVVANNIILAENTLTFTVDLQSVKCKECTEQGQTTIL